MRVALTLVLCCIPVALDAHEAHAVVPAMSGWDVLAAALLVAVGTLYANGLRRPAARGVVPRRSEAIAFWCGWTVMLGAVLPPLDALATQLFSAHMLQHELLMLVGAPLVTMGRPMAVCLWGVPETLRPAAVRAMQSSAAGGSWRVLTAPLVAWALHGLAVWVWHVPSLYDRAVRDEAVHALQHATFVGTSMLFWWGLIYGRYGRAGYGASVLYVFTTALHTGVLGALLTFASAPLVPVYIARTSDPVADQQLAGLIMWVPAGTVLTLLGIALFAAWLGEAERRTRRAMLLVFALAFCCCACGRDDDRLARELTGGDPPRGRELIRMYGCDTCHTIPGVRTADGVVGPPLTSVAERIYLAGRIQNTPENMIQFIRRPHSVDEKTIMPEVGVTERDGRDIAAYLYTLR